MPQEEIDKINNSEGASVISAELAVSGRAAQPIKLKLKVSTGDNINRNLLDLLGIGLSLINNFKPSANGCKRPQNPTTSGPFLRCIPAITLRSANVKYAMVTNKGTSVNSVKLKINSIKVIILIKFFILGAKY